MTKEVQQHQSHHHENGAAEVKDVGLHEGNHVGSHHRHPADAEQRLILVAVAHAANSIHELRTADDEIIARYLMGGSHAGELIAVRRCFAQCIALLA